MLFMFKRIIRVLFKVSIKKFFIFIVLLLSINGVVIAQDDNTSTGEINIQKQFEQAIQDLNDLRGKLLKGKKRKSNLSTAREIKSIVRKLIRALSSVPPSNCFDKLKIGMNEFYDLISEVSIGISCGPNILPPFPEEIEFLIQPDCLPPEEDELPVIDQFRGDLFFELNPIYEKARELSTTDADGNGISDVCE